MTTVGGPSDDVIATLLRGREWVAPMNGVDLRAVERRAAQRQRRRSLASAAGVASIVALAAAGAVAGPRVSSDMRRPANSPDAVVPWVNTPTTAPSASPEACLPESIRVSLGSTGAWHEQDIHNIDLTNVSSKPCAIHNDLLSLSLLPGGTSIPIPTDLVTQETTVPPGQVLHVAVGSPGTCEGAVMATAVGFRLDDGPLATLDPVGIPTSCGPVRVAMAYVDGVEDADLATGVTVTVDAPATARVGSTVRFTVTLTNTSESRASFPRCPAYAIALKRAAFAVYYVLNCTTSPDLDAGQSRTYAMQVEVPAAADSGDEILSWELLGSTASGSTAVRIEGAAGASGRASGKAVFERVTVRTHCGVTGVTVGGVLWLADPPLGDHNAPPGWGANQTSGSFVKTSPGHAEFHGDGGQRAEFRLARPGESDPGAGCE